MVHEQAKGAAVAEAGGKVVHIHAVQLADSARPGHDIGHLLRVVGPVANERRHGLRRRHTKESANLLLQLGVVGHSRHVPLGKDLPEQFDGRLLVAVHERAVQRLGDGNVVALQELEHELHVERLGRTRGRRRLERRRQVVRRGEHLQQPCEAHAVHQVLAQVRHAAVELVHVALRRGALREAEAQKLLEQRAVSAEKGRQLGKHVARALNGRVTAKQAALANEMHGARHVDKVQELEHRLDRVMRQIAAKGLALGHLSRGRHAVLGGQRLIKQHAALDEARQHCLAARVGDAQHRSVKQRLEAQLQPGGVQIHEQLDHVLAHVGVQVKVGARHELDAALGHLAVHARQHALVLGLRQQRLRLAPVGEPGRALRKVLERLSAGRLLRRRENVVPHGLEAVVHLFEPLRVVLRLGA